MNGSLRQRTKEHHYAIIALHIAPVFVLASALSVRPARRHPANSHPS